MPPSNPILVSACLMGYCTRYDGESKPSPACRSRLAGAIWLPVCPEQLGGLSTPRPAAELVGGDGRAVLQGRARVMTVTGKDVSEHFLRGAETCLAIALAQHCRVACLKARSPSCGVHPTPGVTAALLQGHGIIVEEF